MAEQAHIGRDAGGTSVPRKAACCLDGPDESYAATDTIRGHAVYGGTPCTGARRAKARRYPAQYRYDARLCWITPASCRDPGAAACALWW
jgi:hypothetical protein